MKLLFVGFTVFLAGCAQLMSGQEQPVVVKNAKENIYYTTCSGAVEYWGSCYNKAARTCNKNYAILEKIEDAQGAIRTLTFGCKK